MKGIGGYFELELRSRGHYHLGALPLNTGRNALEYILLVNKFEKIYLPTYSCDVLLEPIKKLKISYEYYDIDEHLECIFDLSSVGVNEAFLYTNYYGLKDFYINKLADCCTTLIVDNAQSFYSAPLDKVDTFYSARKFFGVPDGSYVYTKSGEPINLSRDKSSDRFEHLLLRRECGASFGYTAFKANEQKLCNQSISKMSTLTENLMTSLDYDEIGKKRKANYKYLQSAIGAYNNLQLTSDQVPMTYPYLTDKAFLRKKLIDNNIFVPQYWPNVLYNSRRTSFEYHLASNLLCLPIDQRYSKRDMDIIINLIDI